MASVGGESDLMPYLAGRYFGTRSLSTVFGWFLAAFFVVFALSGLAWAATPTGLSTTTMSASSWTI